MKQESRWMKQVKLKFSKLFRRKNKEEDGLGRSPFAEPDGD